MVSQGPSPDEVALVEGASRLGFKLTQRTSSFLTLNFQGEVCIPKPLFDLKSRGISTEFSVCVTGSLVMCAISRARLLALPADQSYHASKPLETALPARRVSPNTASTAPPTAALAGLDLQSEALEVDSSRPL